MAEVARVVSVFRSFDPTGTGYISRGLLGKVLAHLGDREDRIEKLLSNCGGEDVDYEDFINWIMGDLKDVEEPAAEPKQLVSGIFRSFDAKKHGAIPLDCLAKVLQALSPAQHYQSVSSLLHGEDSPSRVKHADDPDGCWVDYDEFIAWVYGTDSECSVQRGVGYFAKPRPQAKVPHAPRPPEPCEAVKPLCPTIEAFREIYASDRRALDMLLNKVKICGACGKPCAITLRSCNACASSLEQVPVTFNDNIFMGFVFGIGQGRFPYAISIRNQSPKLLCFDDPLSMSVCHMCTIPTDTYIPDVRYLFTDPVRGLKLVDELANFSAKTAMEQFWTVPEFRRKYFNGEAPPSTPHKLLDLAMCGMNFPPSLYQLHLQVIHAPMLPFHFAQAAAGGHYHDRRFFPLEYVRAALAVGEAARMNIAEDTSIDAVIDHISTLGIDYGKARSNLLERCRRLQTRFAPWKEADFEYTVRDSKMISNDTGEVADMCPKAVQAEDDRTLRNYGRPYDENNRPSLSYYRYAKAPNEVGVWADG